MFFQPKDRVWCNYSLDGNHSKLVDSQKVCPRDIDNVDEIVEIKHIYMGKTECLQVLKRCKQNRIE